MKDLTDWARLAQAAADVRDRERLLALRLSRATHPFLLEVQEQAAWTAEQFKAGLKRPARPSPRRRLDSSRFTYRPLNLT